MARDAGDPAPGSFLGDVLAGLAASPKSIPPKYFYDEAGSRLFEEICRTPEYYPTRVETALLQRIAPEIAAAAPDASALVEFGSGASEKTRLILDAAPWIEAYAPVDISAEALADAAERLRSRYPGLEVVALAQDFTGPIALSEHLVRRRKLGFFPGSTVGNFTPEEAAAFLSRARGLLGPGGKFVVGVDTAKAPAVLEAAYDDAQGVTAAFNLNLLLRINRELGADFDPAAFAHRAVWNAEQSRIEMHLESLAAQDVALAGRSFSFEPGERLHTENSYKYAPERFEALAKSAGWRVERRWLADQTLFAVFLLGE